MYNIGLLTNEHFIFALIILIRSFLEFHKNVSSVCFCLVLIKLAKKIMAILCIYIDSICLFCQMPTKC